MTLLIFGVIIGSFVSALSWRYPRGISNINGRSFCDRCKNELNWYDNIPLLSYLILQGRCRKCKKHISIRYPIIELLTAVTFYFVGYNPVNLILATILICIFIIDFENQIIPDAFIFVGIFLIMHNFFAGFLAGVILLIIHILTKGRGMGLGDVKFAVLGGMIVGLKLLPVWFFVSFLTGGIVGAILILLKVAKLKDKIAFGPFLIFAIPITLLWGENILAKLLL